MKAIIQLLTTSKIFKPSLIGRFFIVSPNKKLLFGDLLFEYLLFLSSISNLNHFNMLVTVIVCLFIILVIVAIIRHKKDDVHSHWAQLLPNFKFSTKEFYQLVKTEMQSHEIKNISFEEVSLSTSTIFARNRLYLRVFWTEFYYDLCFAPFGDGCFVSWWLIYETSSIEEIIRKIPFIGEWIRLALFPVTYYRIDSASAFMTYAQQSVLKVIDEITKDTGIRLTEDERKPILKNIFDR